jgi:hypothetical protein
LPKARSRRIGNLFVKTDTGRHADLVKIVAGFATPLAG